MGIIGDLGSFTSGIGMAIREHVGRICILRHSKCVVTCLNTMVSKVARARRETYNAGIICIGGLSSCPKHVSDPTDPFN